MASSAKASLLRNTLASSRQKIAKEEYLDGRHDFVQPFRHALGQLGWMELGQKVAGADAPRQLFVEHAAERGVQQNVEMRKPRVLADGVGEGVAVHARHLDVGDHHK